MKFINNPNEGRYLKIGKKFYLYGHNEWSQVFQDCNWYTLTLIKIDGEIDDLANAYEFNVILLGLGFRIRYYRPGQSTAQKLANEAYDQAEKGETYSLEEVEKILDSQKPNVNNSEEHENS